MKKNKLIGFMLLLLCLGTITGMYFNKDSYWAVYNYTVIILSAIGSIVLLRYRTKN